MRRKRKILLIAVYTISSIFPGVHALGASANGQPFQELQEQVDELQDQVDLLLLNPTSEPIEFTVFCPAESVNDALADYASVNAPLIINIDGSCDEPIGVNKDNVTLRGVNPGDGLSLSGAAFPAVGVAPGIDNVVLENLTISLPGSGWGLACNDSTVNANGVTINDAAIGVLAVNGGRCLMNQSVVDGNGTGAGTGVLLGQHGSFQLNGGVITGNQFGIQVNANSDAFLGGFQADSLVEVSGNDVGIAIYSSSNVTLAIAEVSMNNTGIEVFPNSTLTINASLTQGGGGFVNDNAGAGLIFNENSSVVDFTGVFDVLNNGGYGIECADNVAISATPNLSGNNAGGDQHLNCPLP